MNEKVIHIINVLSRSKTGSHWKAFFISGIKYRIKAPKKMFKSNFSFPVAKINRRIY
ncbi:MAG: hypothetical protein M3512_06915 [Bacteroidota bacterium]|nr:hypothetical protein [Bacteroidota bacterium]